MSFSYVTTSDILFAKRNVCTMMKKCCKLMRCLEYSDCILKEKRKRNEIVIVYEKSYETCSISAPPVFNRLLPSRDREKLADTCRALSHLSDGSIRRQDTSRIKWKLELFA